MSLALQTLPQQTGATAELGENWRIQFFDADGIPLNMLSFEVIDFGAISYTEIFQNVKTILATPLFSAALERTLGVDQTIVDRPIGEAAEVTVAILDAVMKWEPRAEIVDLDFKADALNGHLICTLQLKIRNVIYGTNEPYTQTHAFGAPTQTTGELPPVNQPIYIPGPAGPAGPAGAPGPAGPAGARGSLWYTGAVDPDVGGGPVAPQNLDCYLNTVTGDVFQYDGATMAWRRMKRA